MLQGDALFQTHENMEHLAMMDVVLGPMPQSMIARAECVAFADWIGLDWIECCFASL